MFENKITVYSTTNGTKNISQAKALQAIASSLSIRLESHGDFVYAKREEKRPVVVDLYNDGEKVVTRQQFLGSNGAILDEERTSRYSYTIGEAVGAIAEALGLEFRAEYVVGSGTPVLKAVKKTTRRTTARK